jgi:flavin reductase (DIM6/NTAB) family NADH-FMN oxidoreductase RutF
METLTSESNQIDPKLFRQLLGCFPTGVAVITTRGPEGRPAGLTCNSFSSVSLDPPLVLFSIRSASSLVKVFDQAGAFAINILSQRQDVLSARFASGKIEDKFEGVSWHCGAIGMPVIDECLVSFECTTHACHEAGDHYVFIGQVRQMNTASTEQALVFYKGAYMMLAESLRALAAQDRLGPAALDEGFGVLYGALLRLACEQATSTDIDKMEAAVDEIERHLGPDSFSQRAEAACSFFATVAMAAHNEALRLVAHTMISILREQITFFIPARPRPDVFSLRREVVRCVKEKDADGAVLALEELICKLRDGDISQIS